MTNFKKKRKKKSGRENCQGVGDLIEMKRRENCSGYGNELLVWKRLGRIMFIPLGREEESGDRKIFGSVETPGDTGLTPLGETHTLNRRRDDLPSVSFLLLVFWFFFSITAYMRMKRSCC